MTQNISFTVNEKDKTDKKSKIETSIMQNTIAKDTLREYVEVNEVVLRSVIKAWLRSQDRRRLFWMQKEDSGSKVQKEVDQDYKIDAVGWNHSVIQ